MKVRIIRSMWHYKNYFLSIITGKYTVCAVQLFIKWPAGDVECTQLLCIAAELWESLAAQCKCTDLSIYKCTAGHIYHFSHAAINRIIFLLYHIIIIIISETRPQFMFSRLGGFSQEKVLDTSRRLTFDDLEIGGVELRQKILGASS